MRDQEMYSVSETVRTILSENFLSVHLVVVLLSIVIIDFFLYRWLVASIWHFPCHLFVHEPISTSLFHLFELLLSSLDNLLFLLFNAINHDCVLPFS
jgi:hypothetical protein